MKKRIVCVLLTLIMLLSLVPMGASAASREISAAAITVLKQMTTRATECYYHSGSEFRTGYGTVCEGKHSFGIDGKPNALPAEYIDANGNTAYKAAHEITEKNADIALRKALTAYDEKVNTFASANGLSLKQQQHDALVVFSYNAGTGWMEGNGVVKSVIINKGDATELLNAMNQWTKNADMSRRQVEVNMYFNGIYSNVAPSQYGLVKYDPNGGSMPQKEYISLIDAANGLYVFHYDLQKEMNHPVVPTKKGSQFLGWYHQDGDIYAWAINLTKSCDGDTLVAEWQTGYLEENAVKVNYQLHKSHLASKKVYDSIFSEKSNSDKNEDFDDYLDDHDDLFWVDRDMIDKNGVRWSRLNASKTVANGKMISGWVKIGAASDENDSYTDKNGTVIATATVTASGYLNLRQEAGTDNAIVGALAKNDTVNIYEIKTVNGHQWGRSEAGWLCLTYTRVVMKDDVTISDVGVKAYSFEGKFIGDDTEEDASYPHEEPNANSNYAQYPVPHRSNPKLDGGKADLTIPDNASVVVSNFFEVDGELWVKATWKNTEWKWKGSKITDGTEEIKVSRSGWVEFSKIAMNPAKFTVAAASVNVRTYAGDAATLAFTLNKGVQIVVDKIDLVNENIWGHFQVKDPNHVQDGKEGWVNLASKYFSRDGAPSVEESETTKKLVATVIGTDSLKVRKTGATYGQQIGTLKRGTTVAVWEDNGKGWVKVDSNKNGEYDYKEDGWCSEKYLDIHEDAVTNNTVTDSNGNSYTTDGSGKGIVANTYSGVNVRTGPGTAYATNGKLLPGTVVDILETKNGGKWGRVTQGWISMDYVTMVSYNEVIPENAPNGGSYVESFDKADKTTTTAVYTGYMAANTNVYKNPTKDDKKNEKIRTVAAGENVTIYELAKVTENITSDVTDGVDAEGNVTTTTTTTTVTTYWARINEGWVQDPAKCLNLNALDEKVHTQTSVEKLNVRKGTDTQANENGEVFDILVRGDQVSVTALDIIGDKVWGRVDTNEGTGWIRLDYMSEGAIYVKAPVQSTPVAPSAPVLGNTSSTGGYVNNSTGYRYTGKIIRANEVNVRATPSTAASKTTSLKNGAALVIYETTVAENMAWGRCDAGWVYLYYVDLTPVVNGAVDARVVYNENTIIYSDVNGTSVAGTYSRMSTIDIYEIVGKMARTELGWVNVDNLL